MSAGSGFDRDDGGHPRLRIQSPIGPLDRRFEEAAAAANRATQRNPRLSPPYWMRAAALANLGRIDEAKMAQRLLEVQPQFTIASITSAPFTNPEILAALGDALRHVRLPEE